MLIKPNTVPTDIPLVADLADRPTAPLYTGGGGLGAAELKSRFDRLPLAVRETLNTLLAGLASEAGAHHIGVVPRTYGSPAQSVTSLGDLLDALADTGFAELLQVRTGERVCSLQTYLQEADAARVDAAVSGLVAEDGNLVLTLGDATAYRAPLIPPPEAAEPPALAVVHGHRYVTAPLTALDITYPRETYLQAQLSANDGGLFGFPAGGTLPIVGRVCGVTIGTLSFAAVAVRGTGTEMVLTNDTVRVSLTVENGTMRARVTGAGTESATMRIHVYAPFVSELRVIVASRSTDVRLPPSLYRGLAPDFVTGSVWDLHLCGGVVTAREITTAEAAEARESERLSALLAEVANGTY